MPVFKKSGPSIDFEVEVILATGPDHMIKLKLLCRTLMTTDLTFPNMI